MVANILQVEQPPEKRGFRITVLLQHHIKTSPVLILAFRQPVCNSTCIHSSSECQLLPRLGLRWRSAGYGPNLYTKPGLFHG